MYVSYPNDIVMRKRPSTNSEKLEQASGNKCTFKSDFNSVTVCTASNFNKTNRRHVISGPTQSIKITL